MHITYHGLSCFKIIAKTAGRGSEDVTIVFAPYNKSFGLRPPQGNADIILIPHDSPMFNNADALRGAPLVIDRPGEFAVKGINIIGKDAPADPRNGELRGNTVVFMLDIEDCTIAYLGALGADLSPTVLNMIAGADILFLPIGDKEGIDGKTAEVLARKIEAKIIIPMQYHIKGVSAPSLRNEEDFCSQIGNCPRKKEDKLIIKKADLENKAMEIILLQAI
ncbi:MAG: MBL fold metallo-hydrolase [Parcubacteria group bacterium]|jgi:hypothetical protein